MHQLDNLGSFDSAYFTSTAVVFKCVTKISPNSPDQSQSESNTFDLLLTLQTTVD